MTMTRILLLLIVAVSQATVLMSFQFLPSSSSPSSPSSLSPSSQSLAPRIPQPNYYHYHDPTTYINTRIERRSMTKNEDDDNEYTYHLEDDNIIIDIGSSTTAKRSQKQEQQRSQQQKPQQIKRRSILVIDDEPSIRTAVGDYLTTVAGYTVTTFSNARDALDYLDAIPLDDDNEDDWGSGGGGGRRGKLPNAIVSDILMPGGEMDGLQFLSTLRNSNNNSISNNYHNSNTPISKRRRQYYVSIPIILLTAKGMTKDRIRGYELGADGYLTKPFDPEELVSMLESVMFREEILRSGGGGVTEEKGLGSGGVSGGGELEDLRRDLKEIKDLLLRGGGRGDGVDNRLKGTTSSASPTTSSKAKSTAAIGAVVGEETTTTGRSSSSNTNNNNSSSSSSIVLTMDELDVLELLCQGMMNKEMAAELKYSIRWVEGQLTSMYRKTECGNRTELVRWAVAMGYVVI